MCLTMIEDYKKFLNTMKDLKVYLVEFEENELMKIKNYLLDCIIRRDIYYLVIIITYNKYIFSANDGI